VLIAPSPFVTQLRNKLDEHHLIPEMAKFCESFALLCDTGSDEKPKANQHRNEYDVNIPIALIRPRRGFSSRETSVARRATIMGGVRPYDERTTRCELLH
jgi:hypothetical protein